MRYMDEELRRALSAVEPEQRQGFLDELRTRFPSWNGALNHGDVDAAAAAEGDADGNVDFRGLADQLIQRAGDLTPDERLELLEQLASAELVLSSGQEWDPASAGALREA